MIMMRSIVMWALAHVYLSIRNHHSETDIPVDTEAYLLDPKSDFQTHALNAWPEARSRYGSSTKDVLLISTVCSCWGFI
jgi:hypothetical protein